MKPIPAPTESDRERDIEADYDFARQYEHKGDIAKMACAYIRLTQALQSQLAELKHRSETP